MDRSVMASAATSAVIALIGVGFIAQAVTLDVGSPLQMGPGFFPLILGCLCVALAAVDGIRTIRAGSVPKSAEPADWRAATAVTAAMISFILAMPYLGLGPSSFLLVVVSALATRVASWPKVLLLGLAASFLSWAIFIFALSLPISFVRAF